MGILSTFEIPDSFIDLDVHPVVGNNRYYLFDTQNYSIYETDAVLYELCQQLSSKSLARSIDILEQKFSEEVAKDAAANLMAMISNNLLPLRKERGAKKRPYQLTNLVLMLAGGCNLGCNYCFEKDVPIYQKANLLSFDMADKIMAWYFKNHRGNRAHLELYGGEPLLNWKVIKHVIETMDSWSKERTIDFSKFMITNGTMLTPEIATFLAEKNVGVQVSIDGDIDTHDKHRVYKSGKSTWNHVARGIGYLKEADVNFNLRATLTKSSPDPEKLLGDLQKLGTDRVSFSVVSSNDAAVALDENDWEVLNANLQRSYSNASEQYLRQPIKKMVSKILSGRKVSYGCGAGLQEVTIAPDGKIYECQRLMNDGIADISDDPSFLELNSTFISSVDDKPICKSCSIRYLCGGGCKESNVAWSGEDKPPEQFCTMKFSEVNEAILNVVANASMNEERQECLA